MAELNFDWSQYHTLAVALDSAGGALASAEAEKRSAISRAYYAALMLARRKISERSGDKYPRRGTHAWTIGRFLGDPSPDAKRIGSLLKRLKKQRERADYEDKVPRLEREVEKALLLAEDIINKTAALSIEID